MSTPARLTLTRPDDWHLHLRDGPAMQAVVMHTAQRFARAIIMPNLKPPVTSVAQAQAYRRRILDALPADSGFEPLMTLYLTPQTDPDEIRAARDSGIVHAVKLYPAGATTNAEAGVNDLKAIYPILEVMQQVDLPLLVHGESTDSSVDVFDREAAFIDHHLGPICETFASLRVVLEHITTREAVAFVREARPGVAATITAHHLLLNRNAMFESGIRPHHYCLPVLKRERHRQALVEAATSGDPRFFLGTDSAPHPRRAKESACGCAGIYTAHAAIELYAEVFEAAGALDRLEAFASFHGPDFYGLPRNRDSITVEKASWKVPASYPLDGDEVVPLRAGQDVGWRIAGESSV